MNARKNYFHEGYFSKRRNVRPDLIAFARTIFWKGAKPFDLNTSNAGRAFCQIGYYYVWTSYLTYAAAYYKCTQKQALHKLLSVAGYGSRIPKPMSAVYLSDLNYARRDVCSFLLAFGRKATLLDLTTGTKNLYARCSNGEVISWGTLLNRHSKQKGISPSNVRKSFMEEWPELCEKTSKKAAA